ncbi:MAG: hypothetical protein M1836_005887 [Candelina mexicana]|nr:MAG: hypothetical protein M1836_005887 [Candelina mexicana]
MASRFLATHGIDLQKEISKAQFGHPDSASPTPTTPLTLITGVHLPNKDGLWDLSISNGTINSINPHTPQTCPRTDDSSLHAPEQFLAPSLCHPHIHLDKPFLLSDPKYSDLEIVNGDFAEAMELTSIAKARFDEADLLRRGRQLIEESISFGVTSMRAFVEVDEVVEFKCVDAGLALKKEFEGRCEVQICVFAQLAVFSGDVARKRRRLLETAVVEKEGVGVVGSTPYVEEDFGKMVRNMEWVIDLAMEDGKHLDLHLDYHLDEGTERLVWRLLEVLREKRWEKKEGKGKMITLGHCTRLTMFSKEEWQRLRKAIGSLPISFVGLPTSDMFIMGRPDDDDDVGGGQRVRGTLQIPQMIQNYGFSCAIGVNNVGNAFTPQGNCDPLSIACLGVGLYHAGTKKDVNVLYECISSRARAAIGMEGASLGLKQGETADLVLFGRRKEGETDVQRFRRRKTLQEIIYDPCHERITIKGGIVINDKS